MRSAEPFASVLRRRYERRSLLRSVLVAGPLLVLGRPGRAAGRGQGLGFEALPPSAADALEVAAGYAAEVVIAWGDPLDPELGPFDPARQSAAEQERRFGFNNDFNAWFPLRPGSSERGLLFVNHEYTRRTEMFRGAERARATAEQCAIEMAAHGASVVELARDPEGRWSVVVDSGFNRRLSATTPMDLCGPAAGDAALRTAADPSGRRVLGTLNNCSGGKTPWGTALSGEENIPDYFGGARSVRDERTAEGLAAMEFEAGRSVHGWELHEARFDLAFDSRGTLWIATDGQAKVLGSNDALYAVPTAGPERGRTRRFLSMPVGAEVCGPEFTPDERTLFANVQHPGEGGGLEPPTSTWPDGPGHGPRPAVVAVRGVEGGTIGL